MVRPERRVDVAGASPVRVSAGASGSRLQPGGEILLSRAECQEPLKRGEQTIGPQQVSERGSLVKLSAESCLRGPSRSCHGEGNRQHAGPERTQDLPGVSGGGTLGQSNAEQERHYLAAESGKDRLYEAGWLKSDGAGRESERSVVPRKACSEARWREGTLLWSRRRGGEREGMPETANNSSAKARQLRGPATGMSQVRPNPQGFGEGSDSGSDAPVKGRIELGVGCHARHMKKIIVKPYAGKPHVRFERGLYGTGPAANAGTAP